jgi:iron complex outermembrane receptor protein
VYLRICYKTIATKNNKSAERYSKTSKTYLKTALNFYFKAQYKNMKIKIFFLILICFSAITTGFSIDIPNINSARLSGKITEKTSGEPIPGVSIYFPDLKTGTISKPDGTYSIDKLPATKLLVQVRFIGYKMVTQQIDLSKISTFDVQLEMSVTEISEVVVTGQSGGVENNRTPSPIAVVPRIDMLQNSSTNIIDALARIPGISQITTGTGISKPVIRGMGYNRVVVVNDGIRQEGQQWGDEHGIEIDDNTVNRVEILKGPASLAYGSDAMAGVINMLSAPTLPKGSVKGNISTNYQTNNGLINYSLNQSGNKNGLIWDIRYSNKLAHAYQNKYDDWVYNSGFREQAASAILGINRSWGYSHLHLGVYALKPGIIEGERDSLSGKFTKIITQPNGETTDAIAGWSDFHSYQPQAPFQKIAHYKAVWNSSLFIGQSRLEATLGFQQNQRKEFESADEYGLFFLLNTLNYDVKYLLPEKNNWKFTTGINGMGQKSENKGTEFLVPAYRLFDFGIYAIANKKIGNLDLSGGIRFDSRSETGDALYLNSNDEKTVATDPDATERFKAIDKKLTGFSGSLGGTYQISESVYTKMNVLRGYRAPNIAELGSNGVHEGTQRYEIGNESLKPENSLQFDFIFGVNTTHVSTELDLFTNRVNHYIYSNKIENQNDNPIYEGLPVFQFSEGDAQFYGGEFQLDFHPHPWDWLHLENTFSYVRGTLDNQPSDSHNLPFIPAPVWVSNIKIEMGSPLKFMNQTYLKFGLDKTWAQNHVYSAYDTETKTPGHTLLNLGFGSDFVFNHKNRFSLYISANNLTDVAYQSHLSRLKYAGINYATGRTGIYNMGRNISFKLLIPIDFSD